MKEPIPMKKLVSGDLKSYEEEIINFYQKVGDLVELNPKMTTIFAYLQIYEALTQKQLKVLTKYSSSTISTILKIFILSGIAKRELSSYTRSGLYRINSNDFTFQYIKFQNLMGILEKFETRIQDFQKQIKSYQSEYPHLTRFLRYRLNSYRNYFEAQRRAILNKMKFPFLEEDVSKLGFNYEIIQFPPPLETLVQEIIEYLVDKSFHSEDPTLNLIFAHLGIRRCVTQDLFINKTHLSQSTISRFLNQTVREKKAFNLPKEHNKSRIYLLPSLSLYFLDLILETDEFILSWKPKFQRLLQKLRTIKLSVENQQSFEILEKKLIQLVNKIPEVREGRENIAHSKSELKTKAETYQS